MKLLMKLYFAPLFHFWAMGCVGQEIMPGAESAGLGGITVVLGNPWSAAGNPAGLASVERWTAGTSLRQRYLMKELGSYAVALTVPAWQGTISFLTSHEGCEGWTRQTFHLGGGIAIGNALSAGASLCYVHRKAGNSEKAVHQVSYAIGASVRVSGTVQVAFAAFNPFNLYYSSAPYASLAPGFRLGMAYRPHESFTVMTELAKEADYPVSFGVGAEYGSPDRLMIRGGIRLFPAVYSLGTSYRLNRLLIGLAAGYHQYLGFTPCTSLQYSIR